MSNTLKGDLSRYNEMKAFAQFGTEGLDQATRNLLNHGEKLMELLKQGQFAPMSLGEEVVVLSSAEKIDDIPTADVIRWERELLEYVRNTQPDIITKITETEDFDDETKAKLDELIDAFKKQFTAQA